MGFRARLTSRHRDPAKHATHLDHHGLRRARSIGKGTRPFHEHPTATVCLRRPPSRAREAHRIELTDCPQPEWLAPRRKRFTRESLRRTGRATLMASSATGTAQAPSWLDMASLRPVGNRLYRVSCSHIHSASARLRSMAVCCEVSLARGDVGSFTGFLDRAGTITGAGCSLQSPALTAQVLIFVDCCVNTIYEIVLTVGAKHAQHESAFYIIAG